MLAVSHPVVIISGRMRADVERRFANVPLAGITGNHGLEPWGEDPELERLVAGWREVLQRELARLPGVDHRRQAAVDYGGLSPCAGPRDDGRPPFRP